MKEVLRTCVVCGETYAHPTERRYIVCSKGCQALFDMTTVRLLKKKCWPYDGPDEKKLDIIRRLLATYSCRIDGRVVNHEATCGDVRCVNPLHRTTTLG